MEQPVKPKKTLWYFMKKYKAVSIFLGLTLFLMIISQAIFAVIRDLEPGNDNNFENLVSQNAVIKQLVREDNMTTLKYTFANMDDSVIVSYAFEGDASSYGRFKLFFDDLAVAIEDNAMFLEPIFINDAVIIRHVFPDNENRFLIYNMSGELLKNLNEYIREQEIEVSINELKVVQHLIDFDDIRILIILDDEEVKTLRYLGEENFSSL